MRVEPVTASKVSKLLNNFNFSKELNKLNTDLELCQCLGRHSLELKTVEAIQLLREIASTPALPENLTSEAGKFIVDEAVIKRIAAHLSAAHELSAEPIQSSSMLEETFEAYIQHHHQAAKLLGEIIGKEMPNETI